MIRINVVMPFPLYFSVICYTYCQEFTKAPRNTVVEKNQLITTLECNAIDTNVKETFEWSEFESSPTGQTISIDDEIRHPSGASKYGIVNLYDLQVKNLAPGDSGKYRCKLIRATMERFAYIVVLGKYIALHFYNFL